MSTRRKGVFITWSLQGSAPLSIPAGPLLTLQKSCQVEKRRCTHGHPSLPKLGGQAGLGGRGWDGTCCRDAHVALGAARPHRDSSCAEHFHSNRRSPKHLLQKLLSLRCVQLCIWTEKGTFLFYLLISQTWRKSWGFQASSAYPPRGCQLLLLEGTPANSCINHICCEQKGTSGFIMPAFRSTKTQRSWGNRKGSYLFLNFTHFSGIVNA